MVLPCQAEAFSNTTYSKWHFVASASHYKRETFWWTDWSPDYAAFTPSLVSLWGTSPPLSRGQDYWRTLPQGTCHRRDTLTDPASLQPLPLGALSKHTWKKALSRSSVSIWTPVTRLLSPLLPQQDFPPSSHMPFRFFSSILHSQFPASSRSFPPLWHDM